MQTGLLREECEMINQPVSIYNNWSSYDELSDTIDLGVQGDVVIPRSIRPMTALFESRDPKLATAKIDAPESIDIRIIMRHLDGQGMALRTSGRCVGDDQLPMGRILRISVSQQGRPVQVHTNYDRPNWSGMAWAAGEIRAGDVTPGVSLTVTCETVDPRDAHLSCELYAVDY